MNDSAVHAGGCLCGAVRFEVHGPLREIIYCHCSQCRRTSGHFVAATAAAADDLVFVNRTGLQWYRSSAAAQRGFCRTCGSSLLWRPTDGAQVSIMAGTLDGATGLRASEHYFAGEAGDYYSIDDGLPRFATGNPDRRNGPA